MAFQELRAARKALLSACHEGSSSVSKQLDLARRIKPSHCGKASIRANLAVECCCKRRQKMMQILQQCSGPADSLQRFSVASSNHASLTEPSTSGRRPVGTGFYRHTKPAHWHMLEMPTMSIFECLHKEKAVKLAYFSGLPTKQAFSALSSA